MITRELTATGFAHLTTIHRQLAEATTLTELGGDLTPEDVVAILGDAHAVAATALAQLDEVLVELTTNG